MLIEMYLKMIKKTPTPKERREAVKEMVKEGIETAHACEYVGSEKHLLLPGSTTPAEDPRSRSLFHDQSRSGALSHVWLSTSCCRRF